MVDKGYVTPEDIGIVCDPLYDEERIAEYMKRNFGLQRFVDSWSGSTRDIQEYETAVRRMAAEGLKRIR